MNKKVIFALIYRFVFMGIAIIGIILNTGIFSVGFKYTSLLYYTIQSNLLAFLLFAFLFFKTLISVIKDKRKARTSFAPQASFMLMVDISLTFLVFWLMLAPGLSGTDYSLSSFHNQAVHTLTPLAVIFDYSLFNPKEELKAKVLLCRFFILDFTPILPSFLVAFKSLSIHRLPQVFLLVTFLISSLIFIRKAGWS